MKKLTLLLVLLSGTVLVSCTKEPVEVLSSNATADYEAEALTKAVSPESFNWETADWMPTPPGQSKIPVPWVGQGSLSGFYKMDVVQDYKKVDGWRLVYSTFSSKSTAPLSNPYFVLYNVYRGLLRIYLYVTTPFVNSSTYLSDCLYIETGAGIETNMLDYLGGGMVDKKADKSRYRQIQPAPLNGGAPLASERWYMMEYEIAYDPNLSEVDGNNILMHWYLNYCNVDEINLNGTGTSEIKGTIGVSSDDNNAFDKNQPLEGAFAISGLMFMDEMTENATTGANKLNINNSVFKALLNGVTTAVNSFGSGIPKIALNIFNAVFGGASDNPSPSVVSLKEDMQMNTNGNITSWGSFPSMPITWWIPGSDLSTVSTGYIPLYDEPMGVFYWTGDPDVVVRHITTTYQDQDDASFPIVYKVHYINVNLPQGHYLDEIVINPYLKTIAKVTVESYKLLAIDTEKNRIYEFPLEGMMHDNPYIANDPVPAFDEVAVQFLVKVQPKNGAPASYIQKTFRLNYTIQYKY